MAKDKFVVTGEQDKAFIRKTADMLRRWKEGSLEPNGFLKSFQSAMDENGPQGKEKYGPWYGKIRNRERELWKAFYGADFALVRSPEIFSMSRFISTLEKYGRNRVAFWIKNGFEPHFLPAIKIGKETKFPGWKMALPDYFFTAINGRQIIRLNSKLDPSEPICDENTDFLGGITVLVDTRPMPPRELVHVWRDDNLVGEVLCKLRRDCIILVPGNAPLNSRAGIFADTWRNQVRPEIAKKLGLEEGQLRFERIIETYVLSQILESRAKDFESESSIWLEEFKGTTEDRFCFGPSQALQWAKTNSVEAAYKKSFRFLAVL